MVLTRLRYLFMKKPIKSVLSLLSLVFLLTACNNGQSPSESSLEPSSEPTSAPTETSSDTSVNPSSDSSSEVDPDSLEAYYSSIKDQTGEELRTALNKLNSAKKTKSFKYADIKTLSKYTERPATGNDVPSDKMVGFYDNYLVNANWDSATTWNREHVWPDSLGGSKVEGDLFMTRPCSVKINSERGNKYYGTGNSSLYDPGQYVAEYRGIAARIIFYCSIANLTLKVQDTNSGGNGYMGKLSDLLKWNLAYLPSTDPNASLALRVEQNRNDVVQKQKSPEQLQGNRNPFVDHPEYACRIWGRTNSDTKRICGISG